ncbi:MAG TPA: Ni/Fe-hydrogenase cytochrome b subunit [Bryobacteraceae bacterium]|nr:Ni/Fe-hydrogenase cytochrome b subunit [Bryobacteraceae bacterium]
MTGTVRLPRITFWRTVFWFIMAAAVYATYVRFVDGLGSSTNLSDEFPWGIWIGFDVLCGVALAAGGFTLAATVHIFNIEKYKPIVRPAILTAFLGYLLVVVALLFDLGRPYRIWHPLIMWNPRSVMFEVGWCVTLYSTVLSLEFAPVVFERFGWRAPLRYIKAIMIPLVIAGVILSTLHQSSLGTLYLIFPTKLHALWYSPMLPVMFFVSAIALGLAMTIFESWHSSRAFGRHLELPLLSSLGRVLAVLMLFYLCLRFLDLGKRGALNLLTVGSIETYLFGLEIALLLTPTFLLFWSRVRRSPVALYLSAVMVVLGMIVNRLNVSITGMERGSGVSYIPAWTEVAVTLGIIAAGFAIFRLAVQHLPIFKEEEQAEPASAPVYQMAGALGD